MKYKNKRRLLILNFMVLVMHIIISKMKYDKKKYQIIDGEINNAENVFFLYFIHNNAMSWKTNSQ